LKSWLQEPTHTVEELGMYPQPTEEVEVDVAAGVAGTIETIEVDVVEAVAEDPDVVEEALTHVVGKDL
jgi:predicted regulator of amino acid metabolism with ACT domain